MIVNLVRTERSDEGTFGYLSIDNELLRTAEPPWRNNRRGLSSIPYGDYYCEMVSSPRFGRVYEVKSVPGRSHILFHAGNWAGDRTLNYLTNSDGCILPGLSIATLEGQKAVTQSRLALQKLHELTNNGPFRLFVSGLDL